MRIVMMTNTYLPHVGGVARSVNAFVEEYRLQGHDVLVVAPTFEGTPSREQGIVRVPAIQKFNGSDFSVRLPVFALLSEEVDAFDPQVVHSHHPFLLGDTALRVSRIRNLPLVFTHHTMYERYTHYVPADSPAMQRFAIRLATDYANLCDHVLAPSESIRRVLAERGVTTPTTAAPTGIEVEQFARGDGDAFRREHSIPDHAHVVGHVGRLAPEKNLAFLAASVAAYMRLNNKAHFLVVGDGPSTDAIKSAVGDAMAGRLHLVGKLQGQTLIDAYHAMDVFAFASTSETQGMVLAEAMAAGTPVVAIDAPGAREVVEDGVNGRLLDDEDEKAFAEALADLIGSDLRQYIDAAHRTAERYSLANCAKRVLDIYADLLDHKPKASGTEDTAWEQAVRVLETEWQLWSSRAEAAVRAIRRE